MSRKAMLPTKRDGGIGVSLLAPPVTRIDSSAAKKCWRAALALRPTPAGGPLNALTRCLVVFSCSLWSLAAAAAAPLLSPAELDALRPSASVRVVDIRDAEAFANAHIPGAVSAPYEAWRGPASNPGELPGLPALTALVQRLGLTPATHAVVVSAGDDTSDFGAAARVYWTLKVLGLKELSILNGGVQAWEAARLPLDDALDEVAASTYAPALDRSLIATRDDVRSHLGSGRLRLVDARPAAFFRGEKRHPAALVPGTLKGAVSLEHSRWFAPDSALMVSSAQARSVAATLPGDDGRPTVSFCNTGHWAATNWFALSEVAGQKNVKLYPGSMVDWTADPQPVLMDNVPGRAGQLLIDARLWFERTFRR